MYEVMGGIVAVRRSGSVTVSGIPVLGYWWVLGVTGQASRDYQGPFFSNVHRLLATVLTIVIKNYYYPEKVML